MPIATAAARPRSAYFVNVRVMRRMVFPQSSGDANNNGSALSMASATPTTMAATATTMEPAAVEATAVSEIGASMEHVAAADESSAPRDVGMVIEVEPVVVPVGPPMVPSPAIAGKDAEA